MPTHFFFDMDNTLTRSKSPIAPNHVPVLKGLCEQYDVVVVSGHGADMIGKDLGPELAGSYHILGTNGNYAQLKDGTLLWKHLLSNAQKDAARAFIAKVRAHMPIAVKDENDLIEDRGSEIAFSLIGHHEEQTKKEAFDPDFKIRLKLLEDMAADVAQLLHNDVEVRVAGTTVLDMFAAGKNKGYNIRAFISRMGWPADTCIYVGDALFPGGNDETVIGVIPTHAVKDYHETYDYIADFLGMERPMRTD